MDMYTPGVSPDKVMMGPRYVEVTPKVFVVVSLPYQTQGIVFSASG